MSAVLERLHRRMEAAVAAHDFEAAGKLRDQISLLRGAPASERDQDIDISRLRRQEPGRMGLGSSDQAVTPPPGWTPPKRPDPLTTGQRPAKRRKR